MKSYFLQLVAVVVAGWGIGLAVSPEPKAAVNFKTLPPAASVIQPKAAATRAAQAGPSWRNEFGNPISTVHITVGGVPLAGTYIGYEIPAPTQIVPGTVGRRDTRCWIAEVAGGGLSGQFSVTRIEKALGSPVWIGTAAVSADAIQGAFSGYQMPSGPQGNSFIMTGPDFNASGTSAFVGNPNAGGGGNITLSVSP